MSLNEINKHTSTFALQELQTDLKREGGGGGGGGHINCDDQKSEQC